MLESSAAPSDLECGGDTSQADSVILRTESSVNTETPVNPKNLQTFQKN
jgi:hypothetical protein